MSTVFYQELRGQSIELISLNNDGQTQVEGLMEIMYQKNHTNILAFK